MKSLGLIEVEGVTGAVDCLDVMTKTANVEFVTWERKLGGRLVTVIVRGSVDAVTAAVEATEHAIIKPCSKAVIPNPCSETERLVALSASRLTKAKS